MCQVYFLKKAGATIRNFLNKQNISMTLNIEKQYHGLCADNRCPFYNKVEILMN